MKKVILFLLALLTITISKSFGQIVSGEQLPSEIFSTSNIPNIQTRSFALNLDSIFQADTSRIDTALACGTPIFTNIDLTTSGTNIFETDSFNLYQYIVQSNNANAIGIYFNDFYLPSGCKLFAFDINKTQIIGAITSSNNNDSSKFAIQPIGGDAVILEYLIPKYLNEQVKLKIDKIAHFYIDIVSILNNTAYRSSDCYQDVHCAINLGRERAVIKWVYYDTKEETYYTCSGALLNQNVNPNELKPYIYTANHCGKNAELSTAVFYFNYNNPDCDVNGGTTYYTTVGASQRAKKSLYDMFLMELYQTPPPDYNTHYVGWDRSDRNDLFSFVSGVHHPHGNKKAVSDGSFASNTNPNFWRIEWDDYPTAGGSSGSPLFEDFHNRVIGDLSYGTSDCDNVDGIDRYGKLRKQWSDIGGSDKRLKDWLDPNDNDPNEIDGRDPCFDNLLIQNRTFYPANEYQPFNKVTIQASNSITTSGSVIIKNGSEYHFTAGTQITLEPGFETELGAEFTASIASCTQLANNHRIGNLNQEQEVGNDSIYKIGLPDYFIPTLENSIRNFPNPFNNKTTIEYSLKTDEQVNIFITNIYGDIIYSVSQNIFHIKGIYQIDLNTGLWASGTYFYSIQTPSYSQTQKMILIK